MIVSTIQGIVFLVPFCALMVGLNLVFASANPELEQRLWMFALVVPFAAVSAIFSIVLNGFVYGVLFALLYNAAQHWFRKPTLTISPYDGDQWKVFATSRAVDNAVAPPEPASGRGWSPDIDPGQPTQRARGLGVWAAGSTTFVISGIPNLLCAGAMALWLAAFVLFVGQDPEGPLANVAPHLRWALAAGAFVFFLGTSLVGSYLNGVMFACIYNYWQRRTRLEPLLVQCHEELAG